MRYSTSFKIQAVEKALQSDKKRSIEEVSDFLGVGFSTLKKWIVQSKNKEFEMTDIGLKQPTKKERRPEDWPLSDRLNMIIQCNGLNEDELSECCRTEGIYPHHIGQWQLDFSTGVAKGEKMDTQTEIRTLKSKNKALQKELNRKEKALAEAAALLILQKKVKALWCYDEGD